MILLTFDIEEFDVPLEYGKDISFEEQIEVSRKGTEIILGILKKYNIKATFFCTVIFAQSAPIIIKRIVDEGHELASHGWSHTDFDYSHLSTSKEILEKISGVQVNGFRMAKMKEIDNTEVQKAGYLYNSSINPTFIPGRYNYFRKPRTFFKEENILQIPASVTPIIRFPLFWLSFHNLPLKIYLLISKITYKKDAYLHLYFHPWEFINLSKKEYGLPNYIQRNSGNKMKIRFMNYIEYFKDKGIKFSTIQEFGSLTTINKK